MELFIIHVVMIAILLLLVQKLVPGIEVDGFGNALLAGLALGIINALLKPVLLILTLPITILTLGLFLLVINALLLRLAAAIVPGFRVAGFGAAFWGALLLSIFSFGLTLIF